MLRALTVPFRAGTCLLLYIVYFYTGGCIFFPGFIFFYLLGRLFVLASRLSVERVHY